MKKLIANKTLEIIILIAIRSISVLIILEPTSVTGIEHNDSIEENIIILENNNTLSELSSTKTIECINVSMSDIIPPGTIYPRPTYIPSLRQYEINKDSCVDI